MLFAEEIVLPGSYAQVVTDGTGVLGYLGTGTSVGGFPMLVVTWYLAFVLSVACPACKALGYAENEIGRTLPITINGADVGLTLAVAGSDFFSLQR